MQDDKRLRITLAAMRQSLWRTQGGTLAVPRLMNERPKDTTDNVVWIDTSVMPCDCLTKKTKPDYLRKILDSNIWDPRQTDEAKAQKASRQRQRQQNSKQQNTASSVPDDCDNDDLLADEHVPYQH